MKTDSHAILENGDSVYYEHELCPKIVMKSLDKISRLRRKHGGKPTFPTIMDALFMDWWDRHPPVVKAHFPWSKVRAAMKSPSALTLDQSN
jgi:hypothetical protein